MLKGHVFDLQTFTSNAFALFIDKFLDKQSGVATGCTLSNTNNSVTIADGYFVVKGRFLQIISGVTIDNISNNGFYKLICEVDLSKTNTVDTLNQAEIKVVYGASDYPTLTQQDITEGNGTVYQYEFARFKVESGVIIDFTDKRTFVNYGQILTLVQNELDAIESQSNVSLKSDFYKVSATIVTNPAGAPTPTEQIGTLTVQLPAGWNGSNCVIISQMVGSGCSYGGTGWELKSVILSQIGTASMNIEAYLGRSLGETTTVNVKIILMKMS